MKSVALGPLCLAGIIVVSGCSGGGSTAGFLPGAVGSAQTGSNPSASTTDIFVFTEAVTHRRDGIASTKRRVTR